MTKQVENPKDGSCGQKAYGHPCYDGACSSSCGRIHLPVAPVCNIKCNYCVRRHDCANESRPGVTSKVISPRDGLELLRETVASIPHITVIGIAGPGDPLANEATFEMFRLAHREFPRLIKCLSTNGLLLSEKAEHLAEVGVTHVTVTINAVQPEIGAQIYRRIFYGESVRQGEEAARTLIANQLDGIRKCAGLGMRIKVNSVLIPSINGGHMAQVAQEVAAAGAQVQNIMPLIPQAAFSHLPAPTEEEVRAARKECGRYIRQFENCRQCRADAVGTLTEGAGTILEGEISNRQGEGHGHRRLSVEAAQRVV